MAATISPSEEAQLQQTIEMFEVITQSQPNDHQSLEILKEAYLKLGREKDVLQTAKRIASAYVQLGQLSSAILEYETILQRTPNDPDVLSALKKIEEKATNIAAQPALSDATAPAKADADGKGKKTAAKAAASGELEDGKAEIHRLFVESKIISAGDFELCWSTPNLTIAPSMPYEPFIQFLADKGIVPVDKSLKILADKSRTGYIPLDKYDVDIELARSFPADVCRRWCILPFDRMSNSVLVATANPFNRRASQDLGKTTSGRLIWYLASPIELVKNLQKAFR